MHETIIHSTYGPQVKPLEAIFKRFLASAPRRLQSMLLSLQRYSFRVKYRKGSTLLIADTLSLTPLPMSSHETVNDLVYRVEFESDHPDLSGSSDVTLQDIGLAAATDREQTELRTLVESGWPTDKASVPKSVRPYCVVRSELKSH